MSTISYQLTENNSVMGYTSKKNVIDYLFRLNTYNIQISEIVVIGCYVKYLPLNLYDLGIVEKRVYSIWLA